MIKKVIFKILLILILCTNYSYAEFYSYSKADLLEAEKLVQQDKAKALKKISKLKCAIYTNSFAKRFVLPELYNPMPENTGIQAMEFRFEKGIANSPVSKYYFAKLLLYIDNQKMKIQMPGGLEESDCDIHNPHVHFFAHSKERRKKWTKEDRVHFYSYLGKHSMLSFISDNTYQYNKKGKMTTCTNTEHAKNFMPGIDYVKLSLLIGFTPKPKSEKNTLLWLKKLSGADYTIPHKEIYLKDFYKIEIPNQFCKKIVHLEQLIDKVQ